jgi:GNAT superfamily N-acetyltransferase
MPVVNIKGVGKAKFPDDMKINDIRTFLRQKYSPELSRQDALTPRAPTMQASNPSLATRAATAIGEGLNSAGIISDRFGAQQIGKNVTSIGEFLPGIGDATAGDEFGRALKQGDNFGMAMGALGAIPLVGDAAKKASDSLKFKFPDFKIGISENADNIILDKIVIPESQRGTGQGTEFMNKLLADADSKGKAVGLTPSSDFGGSKARLTEFYKRFGFTENKGKNKDFTISESMIRQPSTDKAMSVGGITLNELKDVPYREQQKIAKGLQTGQPVEFYYSRNLEKAPKMTGMDFGQSIEPAGRYMNVDFTEMSGGKNWETGTIKFNNPLVVEHKNTNSTGWKKDLSDKYGGSVGKRLSNKIKKDGYDAIITVDDYGLSETISLR